MPDQSNGPKLDPDKVRRFNKGLKGAFTPTPNPEPENSPAPHPTSGEVDSGKHDDVSADKDSDHASYMTTDEKPNY